ncbi:hypothetical protein INR49_021869 [Caranx melampygus]|nr:hypothetical protein INR49_021869 [Caranx melampygus]
MKLQRRFQLDEHDGKRGSSEVPLIRGDPYLNVGAEEAQNLKVKPERRFIRGISTGDVFTADKRSINTRESFLYLYV